MPHIFSSVNEENDSRKNSNPSLQKQNWQTASLLCWGGQSLCMLLPPSGALLAHATLSIGSAGAGAPVYLVCGLKSFHLPPWVLHQLWVEELWATFVIRLKEGECDSNSSRGWLRVLMLLRSPNFLFPGLLQKCRTQRTWERGELDPVGLRHGYRQVLAGVTAWLLLTLKTRARSNQDDQNGDFSCSVIQI